MSPKYPRIYVYMNNMTNNNINNFKLENKNANLLRGIDIDPITDHNNYNVMVA